VRDGILPLSRLIPSPLGDCDGVRDGVSLSLATPLGFREMPPPLPLLLLLFLIAPVGGVGNVLLPLLRAP
jgi:hypothetical protein